MDSIIAIFNICFCDYGDSFSWSEQNMTIISKLILKTDHQFNTSV